ncbi:MAG: hypothetical protein P8Z79_01415 [Sedimentisphaerales bacterium]
MSSFIRGFSLAIDGPHKPHNSAEVVDRVNPDSLDLPGDFRSQLTAKLSELGGNLIAIDRYRDDWRQNIMAIAAAADGGTQSQALFPAQQSCCTQALLKLFFRGRTTLRPLLRYNVYVKETGCYEFDIPVTTTIGLRA